MNSENSVAPNQATLQNFMTGLAGMPPEEIKKAKILYLRNAILEYETFRTITNQTKWLMLIFAIIPIFWPFLYFAYRGYNIDIRMKKQLILNAIDVWKNELAGERFIIDGEEVTALHRTNQEFDSDN